MGHARTNVTGSRITFVIASVRSSIHYIEIHVFGGNSFQVHSLEQSYFFLNV